MPELDAELDRHALIDYLQHGFVPATTLGIAGPRNDDNLLLDAWSNPLRYSVTASDVDGDSRVRVDELVQALLSDCPAGSCGDDRVAGRRSSESGFPVLR